MSEPNLTFVFAPGGWHGADCFDIVRQRLEARGWPSEACQYPSVGAEPPTKTLADDVEALVAIIRRLTEEGKEIVLVTHSYGGIVGQNAAKGYARSQRKTGGVILFIYLAAFVVPENHSVLDVLGGQFRGWVRPEGDRVYADTPEEMLYHDVEPELRAKAVASLKHQSKQTFLDPATYEPWKDIRCMYLFTEDDRGAPFEFQQLAAAQLGPDTINYHIKTSHSPFLSKPDELIEGLLFGVAAVKTP